MKTSIKRVCQVLSSRGIAEVKISYMVEDLGANPMLELDNQPYTDEEKGIMYDWAKSFLLQRQETQLLNRNDKCAQGVISLYIPDAVIQCQHSHLIVEGFDEGNDTQEDK